MLEFLRGLFRRWPGLSAGGESWRRTLAVQERAEEGLRQSEEHFAQLVAGVRDYAVFLLDPQGNIRTWNAGAERLKGYRAEEIIGQHFSRFYPPDVIEQGWPAEELRRAAAEGRFEDEGWRLRKDGSRFWASVVITALRDQPGEVRGFLKITRDLTERKQAEENARRLVEEEAARRVAERDAQVIEGQREQLRVTLTSIGDAVITTDAAGRVTLLNPVAEALTGWTNEEAAHQPLATVLHIVNETTRKIVENPVAKVLATGHVVGLANHTVLIAKDGTERPVDDSAAPIKDAQGRVTGVVLVFRDTTERRRVEEALRRTHEQLQIVTESMAVPVTRCSRDLKYLWVSKPYADWIGRPAPEIVGRPIVDILGGEAFAQLRPHFEEVLAGHVVRYEEQVKYQGIGARWITCVYTPTLDAAGLPDGWVAVVLDITERKEMEEALQAADRRKDEFLATLAHELRNPLAPIRNAVELLRRAEGNADLVRQATRMMERQVRQMVRLVDDLLDISRITQGKIQLRKERVELAAVVQSAVEASRPVIAAQGHELTLVLPPEPVRLDADPARLAQVFANLLDNAAKYSEKGGRIWLTAERQGGAVTVAVRDTGIGIAAEHLRRIFEMFSQVEPALERSQGGLGIGLALVRGLVELHGGTVAARSAGTGRGSEFVLHLPVAESQAEAPEKPADDDKAKARTARPSRILVVDDNRDTADSLALMLRMAGHETDTAYDGLEAVQAAATFRPQVVLLDIGLPKMSGYEAARHIREQPWGKDMALIALTGWGQEEDKRRALEAGFDHHLTKPVEPAALEKLLALMNPVTQG